jgi:hypothetical protein
LKEFCSSCCCCSLPNAAELSTIPSDASVFHDWSCYNSKREGLRGIAVCFGRRNSDE